MSKKPSKSVKTVKPSKPAKLDIKAELSKASDSVVSKFFDKKKFWTGSKARFSSIKAKPSAVAEAIENSAALCRDAKIDVINILSALTGKSKDEFSLGRIKPLTLFIISNNPDGHGYPLNTVCLSSKELNGHRSFYSNKGDLVTGYTPPNIKKGKYSHPTYKQFSDWFGKLSTTSKIKFIETVS